MIFLYFEIFMGASMEVGYNFWQGDFGKNKKTYLTRAFAKLSIEILTPRSRVYKTLDRGFLKPSIEIFLKPRSSV